MAASFNGGGVSTFIYDVANAQEMQVLVSGGLGEAEAGGPMVNLVPQSGGNSFRGTAFFSGAGDWSVGNNIDDELRAVGITEPAALITPKLPASTPPRVFGAMTASRMYLPLRSNTWMRLLLLSQT